MRRDLTPAQQGILLDAQGNAIQRVAYGDTANDAASRDHELRRWLPSETSVNAENSAEAAIVTTRVRDLRRNETVVEAAISALDSNVIGTGLQVIADPDYAALGWTDEQADEWSEVVTEEAADYLNSTDVDAQRLTNAAGQQSLVLSSILTSDGCMIATDFDPETGSTEYGTCFRVFEIDHLSNENDAADTDTLRGGVELNERGQPVAYWTQDQHPGDRYVSGVVYTPKWTRTPAFTAWGRRRMVHAFRQTRPGQHLGMAIFSALVPNLKTMSDYEKAELAAAHNNALIAAFIESGLPPEVIAKIFKPQEYLKYRADSLNQTRLRSAATIPLPLGDKLSAFNPGRPNPNYPMFVEFIVRKSCAALGLPYEAVIRDFSKSNYSSARAAIMEAWRIYDNWQDWLGNVYCRPTYQSWFEEAVARGRIPNVTTDLLLSDERIWRALTRCQVIGPGMKMIDAVKEADGLRLQMEMGLETFQSACARYGRYWRRQVKQIKAEKRYFERNGLAYPGDAKLSTTSQGAIERSRAESQREDGQNPGAPTPQQQQEAA